MRLELNGDERKQPCNGERSIAILLKIESTNGTKRRKYWYVCGCTGHSTQPVYNEVLLDGDDRMLNVLSIEEAPPVGRTSGSISMRSRNTPSDRLTNTLGSDSTVDRLDWLSPAAIDAEMGAIVR